MTVNTNDTISLWNLTTQTEDRVFTSPFIPQNVALSADGTRLAAGRQTGETVYLRYDHWGSSPDALDLAQPVVLFHP
ncbi:MAG: hypothetical protein H7Y11_15115 [Armatimonadetes bacterium]|nr:hypothetical protein [Anaerolineae bacterium]